MAIYTVPAATEASITPTPEDQIKRGQASYSTLNRNITFALGDKLDETQAHKVTITSVFNDETYQISYAIKNFGSETPVISDNYYTCATSTEGITIKYETYQGHLKEYVLFESSEIIPASLVYSFSKSGNLTLVKVFANSYALNNSVGDLVFMIETPISIDEIGQIYSWNLAFNEAQTEITVTSPASVGEGNIMFDPTISTDSNSIPNYVPQANAFAIKSDKELVSVWRAADSAIRKGDSSNMGKTWTDRGDIFTGQTYYNPRICPDSLDDIHLIYMYGGTLYYRKYDDSAETWGDQETVAGSITGWNYGWGLAVDSSDNVRIVYHASNVYTRQRSSGGVWADPVRVNVSTSLGPGCAISCCAGSEGDVWSVVWSGCSSGTLKILHQWDNGDGYQVADEQVASDTVDLLKPTVASLPGGTVLASWDKNTAVVVSMRSAPPAAADWNGPTTVDDTGSYNYASSVSASMDQNVWIAYMHDAGLGDGEDIKLARGNESGLEFTNVFASDYPDTCPVLAYHFYPNTGSFLGIPTKGAGLFYYNGANSRLEWYGTGDFQIGEGGYNSVFDQVFPNMFSNF